MSYSNFTVNFSIFLDLIVSCDDISMGRNGEDVMEHYRCIKFGWSIDFSFVRERFPHTFSSGLSRLVFNASFDVDVFFLKDYTSPLNKSHH